MGRVSYFQQFSQREDHNTNNILLALSHFHRQRPVAFAAFVAALFGEDVAVGPSFKQQVTNGPAGSRVDGLIVQEAFAIAVETKLGDDYDDDQLDRHALAIDHYDTLGDGALVIGLRRARGSAAPKSLAMGVRFLDLTFTELLDALDEYCSDADLAFGEMLDDLRRTLAAQGLLMGDELAIVPCRMSLAENLETGIYHEPAKRKPMDRARYVGAYKDKAVVAVGRIVCVAVADGEGVRTDEGWPPLEGKQAERVEQLASGSRSYGNLIERDGAVRFYITDGFAPTAFVKATPHPVQNRRYVDLKEHGAVGNETSVELAKLLDGQSFE